jgi:PhzF family phenazine biosynthesis protein
VEAAMMTYDIHVINAFTQQDFAGNPAAVVPLNAFLPTQTMQQIAAQNNLSETAFVVPSDNAIAIRWFHPMLKFLFVGTPVWHLHLCCLRRNLRATACGSVLMLLANSRSPRVWMDNYIWFFLSDKCFP